MKSLIFAGLCALLALPSSLAATNTQQQLSQLAAAGNGIIKLNTETFDLLTSPKRTWSASIQLTALDSKRRCNPCKEFNPSWDSVAKAWTHVPADKRNEHFFATLDFDDGSAVFQRLGLASAPIVYHYPATEGPRKLVSGNTSPVKYDFAEGFEAGPLAQYLSKYTPVTIPYRDPIDWARWITIAIGSIGSLLFLRFISPIVQNKWTWAAVTVITSLVMTSGYMFTRIRNSPFNGGDGNWIASGYQTNLGKKFKSWPLFVGVILIIFKLDLNSFLLKDGLLAFAFLMLTMVVPLQSSPSRQRMQVYLWTGVIMIVYSVLVSLFRVKTEVIPSNCFVI